MNVAVLRYHRGMFGRMRSLTYSVLGPRLFALTAVSAVLLGCGAESTSECDCVSTDEVNAFDSGVSASSNVEASETEENSAESSTTEAASSDTMSSVTGDGSETGASTESSAESDGTTTDPALMDAGATEPATSDDSDNDGTDDTEQTDAPSTEDASAPSSEDDAGTDECTCSDVEDPADVCECSNCEEALLVTTAFHVAEAPDYGDHAPAGGDHLACWGSWGVHETPLPAGNFVHNQEHGGVVFLYNCPDGCAEDVARMQEFVEANELTILTEYSRMSARFAVASWGFRLESECLDMDAFTAFYAAHVDHAPEQFGRPPPPPPASCTE